MLASRFTGPGSWRVSWLFKLIEFACYSFLLFSSLLLAALLDDAFAASVDFTPNVSPAATSVPSAVPECHATNSQLTPTTEAGKCKMKASGGAMTELEMDPLSHL